MPTGYTYPVADGKITEFPDFALSCARAFGALITMRDEPADAPIPEQISPNTSYYNEQMDADKKRLSDVQALTNAEADAAAQAAHDEALVSRTKYLTDRENEATRLNAMLAKVRAWQPPSPDHVEMKKFMIDQLVISMPGEYAPSIPALLDGAAWRKQEIDRLAESIVYSQKHLDEEVQRAAGRTEWLNKLRHSLAA